MKKQDVQENKFRELSDEELKEVTGGTLLQEKCTPKASLGGVCPATYTDKGDECCKRGFVGAESGAGAVLEVVAEAKRR